jgi:DNA polymerase I-like protein with 3'-5' exonuclease and polymerase domains
MPLYFADIEADNLYEECTKIHCAVFQKQGDSATIVCTDYEDIEKLFTNPDNVIAMHNGLSFDKRAVEKLLGIKVTAEIVDTMFMSWYLYPEHHVHGLAAWGERFGHAKPVVDDWVNLPVEVYVERCKADVVIQEKLWDLLWADLVNLYGNNSQRVWHVIDHLNFKGICAALQEDSKWRLDVPRCEALLSKLTGIFDLAKSDLALVMPKVPIVKKRNRPKNLYKASGELSKRGIAWVALVGEHYEGKEEGWAEVFDGTINVVDGYKDPNPGSVQQVKAWLYDLGWVPMSFKYDRNKETNEVRKIPQIKNPDTSLLCDSIECLVESNPELYHLRKMSIVKHRMGVCDLFLKNCDDNGFVTAEVSGFTNTLRFKHRVCVNIPTGRVDYGSEIRACLIARDNDHELCGSDMASLEDRTKQHYMWAYDPDYVTEMSTDDFDPHLDMALLAGLLTEEQVKGYKEGTLSPAEREFVAGERFKAKTTNYSATYGAGFVTIARAGNFPLNVAESLHETYHERNWSIKAIADNCEIKLHRELMWLWNPVAKMYFYLKHDKDKFSTLNQSTGTFCFDRWMYHVIQARKQVTAQFHDEGVWELRLGQRDVMVGILNNAMAEVNKELKLHRELSCDIQFAKNYSEVH